MELRNLFTFLKVVETGSFSKAAEQLLYSQSTVTVQIQQLEEELHVHLFDRIGKKVFVTDKGWELHTYAQQIADLAQKISCIGNEGQELYGELRIVSIDSLMVAVLPDILLEYHKRYPKVDLVVKSADSMAEIDYMLSHNEADFGFLFLEKQGQKDLYSAFSHKERIVFSAPPTHPLAAKRNISMDEIAKEKLIVSNKHASFTEILSIHAKSLTYEISPTFDIWNATGAMMMVKRGGGIGLIPYYLIADAVKSGELCVLDVPEMNLTVWVQALYHQHKAVTPQMKAFFSLLQEIYPAI
ncbi:LysR substrate-binding domain-containing protein [Anaerotignum sp.]